MLKNKLTAPGLLLLIGLTGCSRDDFSFYYPYTADLRQTPISRVKSGVCTDPYKDMYLCMTIETLDGRRITTEYSPLTVSTRDGLDGTYVSIVNGRCTRDLKTCIIGKGLEKASVTVWVKHEYLQEWTDSINKLKYKENAERSPRDIPPPTP